MMKDLKNWKDELLKETVWDHNGDILSTNEDEWICKFFNFKCTLREFFSPIFITFVSSNKKNNPKLRWIIISLDFCSILFDAMKRIER